MKIFPIILVFLAGTGLVTADELPMPTGPFPVGTKYLTFADSTRYEPFTFDTGDVRVITARVWYPARLGKDFQPAPYIPNLDLIYENLGIPESFNHTPTFSFWNRPVIDSLHSLPVLIYSHGWGEYVEHNTNLMEELASYGYIVFSIAHHHEAKFWTYPDFKHGVFTTENPEIQERLNEQRQPGALSLFQRMPNMMTVEEQDSLCREASRLMPSFMTISPRIWADDIDFIIGQVEKLNRAPGLFQNRMDPNRIGVFGMSMGGIASALVCARDDRCRAGINIDGGLYGDILDSVISPPFLFLSSERYCHYGTFFLNHVADTGYAAVVEGSDHLNFSDYSAIYPTSHLMGTIDGQRVLSITRYCVRAFFDCHLKGEESLLLSCGQSEYPEILLECKH